jgi:hypothetical protein
LSGRALTNQLIGGLVQIHQPTRAVAKNAIAPAPLSECT